MENAPKRISKKSAGTICPTYRLLPIFIFIIFASFYLGFTNPSDFTQKAEIKENEYQRETGIAFIEAL
jgi:hypothetical protein